MFTLGIICGVLLSILAVIAGKKFSPQINSEKLPFEKQEKGYVIKLEDYISKLIQQ